MTIIGKLNNPDDPDSWWLTQYRECAKCKVFKPDDEFRDYGKSKKRSECRTCESTQGKFKRQAHKKAGSNPGYCQCCGKKTMKLVVDHCHDTGEFRGWLCRNCNTGMGKLGDTVDRVLQALNYLLRAEKLNAGKGIFEVSITRAATDKTEALCDDVLRQVCDGIFDEYFDDGGGI